MIKFLKKVCSFLLVQFTKRDYQQIKISLSSSSQRFHHCPSKRFENCVEFKTQIHYLTLSGV